MGRRFVDFSFSFWLFKVFTRQFNAARTKYGLLLIRPGFFKMNDRRGELIRRHSRYFSRSNSHSDANTDEDSENSRCPSPLLTVEGGYRVDPFAHYPVHRASKGVRFMADYCGCRDRKLDLVLRC